MTDTPLDDLADDALADRARREPAAFKVLYNRFARRVFGLLRTMRLDNHTSDDIAQQVWMKVWEKLPAKPADSPFCAWLMQIARNSAVDQMRKKKTSAMPEDAQFAAEGHRDVLADVAETAELESFRACIGKLPEVERRIFLHRLEGVDSPAIAENIGLPCERVHRLFHEAKQKVRRCLGVE